MHTVKYVYFNLVSAAHNIIFFSHAAVNYVAISDALGVSSSVLAAGLAADNVICAVYFTTLFALASKIPPENSTSAAGLQCAAYKLISF